MLIHVIPKTAINETIRKLDGKMCVISITDPDSVKPDIDCDAILRLEFHDLDRIWPQLNEVTYFSDDHAVHIKTFIDANKNCDHLVVHCEAGISRSPAIAAAIQYHLGEQLSDIPIINKYPAFNRMVYVILMMTLGFERKNK